MIFVIFLAVEYMSTVYIVLDNQFYVIGGWNSENGFCSPTTYTERYDYYTDTWTEVQDMKYGRGRYKTHITL